MNKPFLHLAIGVFDGVHLGHRAVIHSAREAARRLGGQVGVLTFDPHPSRLLRPDSPTPLIFNRQQKDERLIEAGAQFIHHQNFDLPHASMPAEDFPRWLKNQFPSLLSIHIGKNFHYGRGRSGQSQTLIRDAQELGLSVHVVDAVDCENAPISSSRIRQALSEGNLTLANQMLLRPYEAEGTLSPGRQLGRTLGYPTINLSWNPELIPAYGVYAVECVTPEGTAEAGVANWGLRPTVENHNVKPLLETHLLQPVGKIPVVGDCVRVRWLKRLRDEIKFPHTEALKSQIAVDESLAKKFHGLL